MGMTSTHGRRLIGYVRVSDVRGREGDSYITEDVQENSIRAYAKANGHDIIDVLTDRDKSGGTMDRPAFNEAMRRVFGNEADGIIVYRVNRFGRTLSGGLIAAEKLTDAGKTFVSASEGADPTTKAGKLVFGVLMLMAEIERDTIGENWRNAKASALARGIYISATPPWGYGREDGRLVIDAQRAPFVLEAYQRRARNETLQSIADWLTEATGERFMRYRVQVMLENPAYKGVRAYKGFDSVKTHEAIVPDDVWEAAAGVPRGTRSWTRRPHLLSGLARCAGCRYRLRGTSYKKKGDDVVQQSFSCKRTHAAGTCGDPVGQVLTQPIIDYVEQEFLRFAQGIHARAVPLDFDLTEAEEEVRLAREDAEAFGSSPGAARLQNFESILAGKLARVDQAEASLASLQGKAGLARIQRDTTLIGAWPDLPLEAKQELLGEVVKCVFLRSGRRLAPADRVRIVWADEDVDLPRKSAANGSGVIPFDFD
jgi:DNA invertase Pin-like site-specific DNA recombinase